jgi:flagellar motility protein MotE (MotC chaperone)
MMRLRPLPMVIGALAVAGIAKTADSVVSHAELRTPGDWGFFVGAATAAASAEDPAKPAAPDAAPAPQRTAAVQPEPIPEEMLAAIERERELLAVQKNALAQRASEVELSLEKLEIETARLSALKQEVETLLRRVEQAHTDDVDRLVALYRNMKPKDAANIMNDLDIEVTVLVMGAMGERDAAQILAQLNPVRARAISKIILERSKLPGDQRLNGVRLK